jgi:hypothetical protein
MKTGISVASVLACVFSLDAQIATTLNRLPDGSTEIRIRNNSSVSLVAFAISVNVTSVSQAAPSAPANHPPLVAYYDPAIDPATQPLLPSQERVLPPTKIWCAKPRNRILSLAQSGALGPGCELEQPVVTAGIFEDGSTTGDAPLLARMMLRRSNMLLAVETALETLSDAGRRNVPREQLIEQFRRMADSARRWYLPPEQQVAGGLYQSIIGKLVNLPEEQLGSSFSPATFAAQETAMLRQRRVILLESQPSLADAALITR